MEICYDNVIRLYLDNMLRDKVIISIPQFFQQLFKMLNNKSSVSEISFSLVKDKIVQVVKETVFDNIHPIIRKMYNQEKYFCIEDYQR